MMMSSSSLSDEAFSPELLRLYYARLFPYEAMCQWLGYDPKGEGSTLQRREFCFTLENDVYCRYKSFSSAAELKAGMVKDQPRKIDIGAIFNVSPREHLSSSSFAPQQRELVFDVDLSDYDDVRTCCSGATVCRRCWSAFIGSAVKVVDRTLREDFGFTKLLWVYSGRRGVHCWVADDIAKNLTDQARSNVIQYLSLARSEKGAELSWPIHPSLDRAFAALEPIFQDFIIPAAPGQGHLAADPEKWDALLATFPSEQAKLVCDHWKENDVQPRHKWLGVKRWIDDQKNINNKKKANALATTSKNKGSSSKKQKVVAGDSSSSNLDVWKYDTVFKYAYPRLDENVSKMRNHLLKAPFAVHPKTGRVCIPFDPAKVDDFDPLAVPTLGQLAAQIDADPDKSKPDLDKTALKEHVAFFQDTFLKPILDSALRAERRAARTEREKLAAISADF